MSVSETEDSIFTLNALKIFFELLKKELLGHDKMGRKEADEPWVKSINIGGVKNGVDLIENAQNTEQILEMYGTVHNLDRF